MKRIIVLVLVIAMISLVFTGCVSKSRSLPGTSLPLADADYEVLGDTQAEFTLMRVLIFNIGEGKRNLGTLSGSGGLLANLNIPVDTTGIAKNAALYKALEQMPDADMVIEPRYKIDRTNYYIFEKVTVQVTAKAVKLKLGDQIADD